MTYAFTFDATFCSGCKACQAACKDKNNLPLGVLWRRVYEVSGGSWHRDGEAWNNTVFAYNLSIACNHCIHPKCAGICPANAYNVREDGIVILDTTKCMGCGYCAWACPYGAPQYNPEAGFMTKCNFCFDDLDQGLPPACVAACPMRVLEYVQISAESVRAANEIRLWDAPPELHPYPLPNYSRTEPRVAIKPHAMMNHAEKKFVANLEEIQPRIPSAWEDVPLILFTFLTQMAIGGFWAMLWTFPLTWVLAEHTLTFSQLIPLLLVGLCLCAGLLASLAHLGTKQKALFALRNLRRSWLSREVLFSGLFGAGWLFTMLVSVIWHRSTIEGLALTATLGLGLVYSMAQVYRLRAVPAWNTWRTNVGFMVSALLLGQTIMATLLSYETEATGNQLIAMVSIVLILLLAQFALIHNQVPQSPLQAVRLGLILVGVIVSAIILFSFNLEVAWPNLLVTLIVVMEEGIGRWVFYRSRV
jgi:anaerobic dimethyl sulfoxide reductase subunit B (iron-sulfur subunit)